MARESWLRSTNEDHVADAMFLCQGGDPGECVSASHCRMDGFCFRGLNSPEHRRHIEDRLAKLEKLVREISEDLIPERIAVARRRHAGSIGPTGRIQASVPPNKETTDGA